ncbi:hypothetical protein CspeluHIS016_0306930 [Cutaneotrichosporon spelunceum]|uniref:Uncharacterized protein n=1 Tax=Cutaneotrichosporon spelunceum TaxID=1672016 RepID=A0AAD3TUG3_9TREE|nr:hypothetical protein CspeluHIS016_0306930 [Cutaneotrichosporon spelunceum]
MAFSSLADELNFDSGFPMSPSGPGLSLADEFGGMGGGTLADELVDDLALADYPEPQSGSLGLENSLDGLDDLGDLGGDGFKYDSHTPRRPTRGRPRTPDSSTRIRSRRHDDCGEDELDLEPLRSAQAAGKRMLSRLQTLEPRVPLEERLAGYVSRMGAAERVRDEQTREAAALLRELEGLASVVTEEDVAYVDLLMEHDSPRRRTPPLNLIEESDDELSHDDSCRSPLSPLDPNTNATSPRWPDSPSTPVSLRRRLSSPRSPLSPSFPNGMHASSLVPHRSVLAVATADLGSATGEAADALSKLARASATAVQVNAAASETSRQLRKLRVGVVTLREGVEAEDEAQRGIDAWEAAVASGSVPDVRGVLASLMAGFEERLSELARAHEGLQSARIRI